MRSNFFKFGLFIILAVLFFGNCSKDNSSGSYVDQADCTGIDAATNTYTKSIKAILDAHCANSGCHDAFSRSRNIDLSTYASSKSVFENTDAFCSIHWNGCNPMPQGSAKLSDAILQKIDCWAKNGYAQ